MKLISGLFLFSSFLLAQTVEERIDTTFKESYKNYDLECSYFRPEKNIRVKEISKTSLNTNSLSRDFLLIAEEKELPFTFSVYENSFKVVFSQSNETLSGVIGRKNFFRLFEFGDGGFFIGRNTIPFRDEFLGIKLSKLKCNIEFAKSEPIVLKEENHINVHPHTRYDYLGITTDKVSEYFKTHSNNHVLIDGANRQGVHVNLKNFFSSGTYNLNHEVFETKLSVPLEIPMTISPAGYNDYVFPKTGDVNIVLTGGNHNYCIWNNTRNLMWGLFYSESEANLNITYDTSATVVQRGGIIPGTSFSRREVRYGNLLEKLLKNKKKRSSYHRAYNYYFEKDFVLRFKGLYKTLEYSYRHDDLVIKTTIQGTGKRNLKINLNYM